MLRHVSSANGFAAVREVSCAGMDTEATRAAQKRTTAVRGVKITGGSICQRYAGIAPAGATATQRYRAKQFTHATETQRHRANHFYSRHRDAEARSQSL